MIETIGKTMPILVLLIGISSVCFFGGYLCGMRRAIRTFRKWLEELKELQRESNENH